MHQPTFARVEFERDGYKTRRQKFLERLDGLVPWQRFEAAIEPHYPKPGRGRRGRRQRPRHGDVRLDEFDRGRGGRGRRGAL